MDSNRKKNAAQWFYSQIFRDEPIPQRKSPKSKLPPLLQAARSLEAISPGHWQSREAIFLKQAKLLENYEDDFLHKREVFYFFPTYQTLSDSELRGYFTWRTQIRQGIFEKTFLTYAFLYIYELLNQIGVESRLDGYQKLLTFRDTYSTLDEHILFYLDRWLVDYIAYYDLDPELLACHPQMCKNRNIVILNHIQEQSDEKIIYAVKQLASKWLGRSRFYAANQADCDAVILRSLRRISLHYATRTKKTMAEQFFGKLETQPTRLFGSAVFCNPLKKTNAQYQFSENHTCHCQNGQWYVTKHNDRPAMNLVDVLKTIDGVLREETKDKHPIKYLQEPKWMLKIIREEAKAHLNRRLEPQRQKITIDHTLLAKIRAEAAITQEKLTVEEEWEEPEPTPPVPLPTRSTPPEDTPLSPTEYRLLQTLLYGGTTAWIQEEGHLLSVLVDSINEKLYDQFQDSILDDSPALIEDYIDELKEMIVP